MLHKTYNYQNRFIRTYQITRVEIFHTDISPLPLSTGDYVGL